MADVFEVDGCAEAEGRRLLTTAFETAPAGGGLAGAGLLRQVRRQAVRSRRARVLAPAGAVAALGGAAAALALTLTATVAGAPSAFAAVTAAAAKTSAESFQFTAVQSTRASAPAPTPVAAPAKIPDGWLRERLIGAFAPARGVGEESSAATPDRQVVFAGGHVYAPTPSYDKSAHGKPWLELLAWPQSAPASGILTPHGFADGQPVDPARLLALLKSITTVHAAGPASGPGWTGTKYTFTVGYRPGQSYPAYTGTVYVDTSGLVRRLVTKYDIYFLKWGSHHPVPVPITEDLTFSDFGCPVTVTPPPASQVDDLGQGIGAYENFIDAYMNALRGF
jgi:hypothetical protein